MNWRRTVALVIPLLVGVPLLVTQAWAADPVPSIKVNEVESNGGTPGDWAELTNTGTTPVDVSGWIVKDNDDTHVFTIAAGTTVAPGAFLPVDVETSYGLGGADSVRVFLADGTTLVDTYTWAAHAPITWGRCPDGTGEFAATVASTKGAANDCGTPSAFVKINEIESNGGTPGDWVELVNVGPIPVNIGGWIVKDNDDTHVFTVPAGTTIAPGAFLALDTEVAYGLGGADSVRVFLADGVTLVDSHTWATHAAVTYGRCPNGTGAFADTAASTKGAANDCGTPASTVKLNEIESNGGTPGDWVELTNTGATPVDVSGWIVKDNDDTHIHTIPAGTTIAAGGFLPVDVETSYGLGGADSARLYSADGLTLLDSHTWAAHAAITWGRCPDGTGEFKENTAATKGAANACGGSGPSATPWPGGAGVATADGANVLGGNMSGLYNAESGALWAVKNGPGTLYRLEYDGTKWAPVTTHPLKFPTGLGDPDAEGVTMTPAGVAGGVFVSTERDNGNSGVSRPAILRFDPTGVNTTLNATKEWVLTADLPVVGANLGLEAITWVPDSYLTSKGFVDEKTGAAYKPADYPNHGEGLFFVGVEGNGSVYAYALDQNGTNFTKVATIVSGFPGVMELTYDPEIKKLWVACDDTCQGRVATFDVNASGAFASTELYERPAGLPNLNNEGFAVAPQNECVAGRKPAFWTDDSNTGGHALRIGTVNCTVVDQDADDDGIGDNVDVKPSDATNETFSDKPKGTTSGKIQARGGRTVTVSETANPAGVLVAVGEGTLPAKTQFDGVFGSIEYGTGSYRITGDGKTSTVAALSGQAVLKVTVNGTPVTLTVGAGGSVTLTEVPGNGTVAGVIGIEHTGDVTLKANGVGTCGDIVVRNVIVATAGAASVSGTSADDLIIGRSAADVIAGNGGDDCVYGQGGDDTVTTADGADHIDAGNGVNVVTSGGGDDWIQGGNDADTFDCGSGTDVTRPLRGANVNVEGRCETF
ncbi:lamin tail domain-containing protein [Herbidospora mongoliensis]|uniref:lamin tail domain-containing protein n=1 Tax=Herbidospora mongoliensis TaxID=688067 RepID=UPI000A03CEBD|nr:lamin tail domain-containing protein [Herbidospora mongoliensis]